MLSSVASLNPSRQRCQIANRPCPVNLGATSPGAVWPAGDTFLLSVLLQGTIILHPMCARS